MGLVLFICSPGYSQPYAIPGALGFAKNVRGAYAGSSSPMVLTVDRLTDDLGNNGSNKGSFRWCLTRTYPRIILFEVSGYINLTNYIRVTSNYVSIYGQTAPSPGITISGVNVVDFRCNYVVMQHLRFRSSYDGIYQIDGLTLYSGSNVFIDHCSFSYSEDECLGIGGTFGSNVTVQNCIFAWPLHFTSSKGMLIASNSVNNVSLLRSAFIHCADRTPFPNSTEYAAFETVNTLTYNAAYYGQSYSGGNATNISIIGNEWRHGPNSSGQRQVVRIRTDMDPDARFYLHDNYSPARVGSSEWNGVVYFEDATKDSTDFKSATSFAGYETDYYSHTLLNDNLIANAGARPWDRDSVDILALNDMVNLTGARINTHADAYYPTLAQNTTTLNIPASPHTDSGNGYTNLEVWVYNMTDTSHGTNIVLLTDTAVNGGDVAQYNWLVANGFTVDKLDIGNDIDLTAPSQSVVNQLNAAGLVIIGRDANSNKYDGTGQDVIDNITAPVIITNPYGARYGVPKLWFKDATMSTSASGRDTWLHVTNDTIFANSNIVGDSIDYSNSVIGLISPDGTHNGTVIGSVGNRIGIVRFAKNIPYNDSITAKTPRSDRTIFSLNNDNDTCSFSLAPAGQAAYYSEICRMLKLPITAPQHYFYDNSLKKIVLLTDTANNGGDVAQYEWLIANKFNVEKLDIGNYIDMTDPPQAIIDKFNAADLVLVGRDANSNKYDGTGQDVIDSITAPVIINNPYGARYGVPKLWFKDATVAGTAQTSITVTSDPIFASSHVASNSFTYSNGTYGVITPVGTHNGSIIGSVGSTIAIVRFEEDVPYNDGVGAKTPQSDRTIFPFNTGTDSFTLSNDGQAAYYAEIRRMMGLYIEVPISYYTNTLKSASIVTEISVDKLSREFIIYPNPVNDYVTINGLDLGDRLNVYNSVGQVISKTVANGSSVKLNLLDSKPGIYLIKVERKGKAYSSKFIKQ
ncbi:MAG: hypothetical protein A2W92_07315 [Bacteroidetes bacterium GWA2_42_15]|nr:MAG: hypothetical protein A2W92_07315 [Bacteroidetes bacterium GWA2_42_15]